MGPRGRPRKHLWFSLRDLENQFSLSAQYLKWASSNNVALQTIAATGCPRCHTENFELRHDQPNKNIRFHCFECRHQTSYSIKMPKPGSFRIVPVLNNGVQIGEKIVDFYHPATERQRSDASVLNVSRAVDNGRISLGGEWYYEGGGGVHNQKRFYLNFEEVILTCRWNRMQAEHERRLRKLEVDSSVWSVTYALKFFV